MKYNMEAYYYSFDRTKVDEIDKILSAVAEAGAAYHKTYEWNDATPGPFFKGRTPIECIQGAAQEAANIIKSKDAEILSLREQLLRRT